MIFFYFCNYVHIKYMVRNCSSPLGSSRDSDIFLVRTSAREHFAHASAGRLSWLLIRVEISIIIHATDDGGNCS